MGRRHLGWVLCHAAQFKQEWQHDTLHSSYPLSNPTDDYGIQDFGKESFISKIGRRILSYSECCERLVKMLIIPYNYTIKMSF